MISDPRDRHKRAGELDQFAADDVHRPRDPGGPGGQVGHPEGPLDLSGPDAGPEDTVGRAVREVSRVVRRPERGVRRHGLGGRRAREPVGPAAPGRRAQTLDERAAAVRPAAEHRREVLAPERQSEWSARTSGDRYGIMGGRVDPAVAVGRKSF